MWPGADPPEPLPYSAAIKAGQWVFVSGQVATDYQVVMSPGRSVAPPNPYLVDALEQEARIEMSAIAATLEAAGCDLSSDVVRSYQWLASPHPTYEEFEQGSSTTGLPISSYLVVFNEALDEPRAASTALGVRRLPRRGERLAIDMIAMAPGPDLVREGVEHPPGVPRPVARYSPALRAGDWVFLAGDLATDFQGDFMSSKHMGTPSGLAPEARVNPYFWYGSSIETQTDYTLEKLEKLAESAGTSLARCVKADVYIGHPQDFAGFDRAWQRWFPNDPPARVVIPYMGLAAQGCRVEISLQLLADDSALQKQTIETSDAPEPLGHEPQAIKAGDLVFFSTQMAFDSTGALAGETARHPDFPHYGLPSKLQTRYIVENVTAICEAAGTSLGNICRRQAFHDDLGHAAATLEEWQAHFPKDPPASVTIEVGGPLVVPGAHLLLDLIGYAPDSP